MIRNGEIFAQPISKNMPALIPVNQALRKSPVEGVGFFLLPGNLNLAKSQDLDLNLQKKSVNGLSAHYYVDHLGLFCKAELRLEKAVSLPVKFRLGSVAYTDYMEQKPNANYGH